MSKLRVGIIGGGWSGLYTAKYCKEAGLEPVVLEQDKQIGGQWLYDENKKGGVKTTTQTVSSKLYMSPSDLPYDESMPEFLSAKQVHDHLVQYSKHFDLNPHIQLNTQVQSVAKNDKQQWVVQTNHGTQIFDKLVVATGANKEPRYPSAAMYQNFTGKTYHSHDLKVPGNRFKGRRVLIIGGSDTASDLACELSESAKDVTVSARSGIWFQDRYADEVDARYKGYPADMNYNRLIDFLLKITNYAFINYIGFIEQVEKAWGVRGSSISEWYTPAGYLETYYTKSRNLVRKVRQGEVNPARGVSHIAGNQVKFEQDDNWHTFDDIIYCTGYKPSPGFEAPFDIGQTRFRKILSQEDESLGFVGYVRPYVTSITMLVEMQARWLAKTFAGEYTLPSKARQQQLIASDESYRKNRFPMYCDRMPNLVDPYHYCDTLAKDIGQYPNYLKLLFTKPKIAFYTFFDSWNIFCYNLNHPDETKRNQAEQSILEVSKHPIAIHVRDSFWNTWCWFFNKLNPFHQEQVQSEAAVDINLSKDEGVVEARAKPILNAYQPKPVQEPAVEPGQKPRLKVA